MTNAAVNTGVQISLGDLAFSSAGYNSDMGLWDKASPCLFILIFRCPEADGVPPVRGQIRGAGASYATAAAAPDPLMHCAGPGIEPASWPCRGAPYSIAPPRELLRQVLLKAVRVKPSSTKFSLLPDQGCCSRDLCRREADRLSQNPHDRKDLKVPFML